MAIIDKNDKNILDLLENNYPIKMIQVDFNDLNNKNLIIKSSFHNSYEKLDDFERQTWYFVIMLNAACSTIDVIGLVSLEVTDNGYLRLNFMETNENVFRGKGYSRRIIDYLKRFCAFRNLKGIIVRKNEFQNFFTKMGFEKYGTEYLKIES